VKGSSNNRDRVALYFQAIARGDRAAYLDQLSSGRFGYHFPVFGAGTATCRLSRLDEQRIARALFSGPPPEVTWRLVHVAPTGAATARYRIVVRIPSAKGIGTTQILKAAGRMTFSFDTAKGGRISKIEEHPDPIAGHSPVMTFGFAGAWGGDLFKLVSSSALCHPIGSHPGTCIEVFEAGPCRTTFVRRIVTREQESMPGMKVNEFEEQLATADGTPVAGFKVE
jgi:hypothetical protein